MLRKLKNGNLSYLKIDYINLHIYIILLLLKQREIDMSMEVIEVIDAILENNIRLTPLVGKILNKIMQYNSNFSNDIINILKSSSNANIIKNLQDYCENNNFESNCERCNKIGILGHKHDPMVCGGYCTTDIIV